MFLNCMLFITLQSFLCIIYVCMYVCMYVYIYIYIYIYTHTYIYIYTHTYIYSIYINYIYIHIYIHVYIYIYIYIYIYTHTHNIRGTILDTLQETTDAVSRCELPHRHRDGGNTSETMITDCSPKVLCAFVRRHQFTYNCNKRNLINYRGCA